MKAKALQILKFRKSFIAKAQDSLSLWPAQIEILNEVTLGPNGLSLVDDSTTISNWL